LPDTVHPKVIWVLIGTNDFADLCSRGSILAGNIAVLKEIMNRKPHTKVVINSILPVGPAPLVGGEPNRRWMAYQWINTRLECLAATSENLFFFNGTSHFLTDDGQQINHTLMSDYLHPSKEGSLLLGSGIVETLSELLV
jgi:lysophospholipase L1-like esterase